MKSFIRLAISFFVLCLVIFSIAYFFGPSTFKEGFQSKESPVGQLRDDANLKSPGQPDRTPASAPSESK